jgi:hypothetical protein
MAGSAQAAAALAGLDAAVKGESSAASDRVPLFAPAEQAVPVTGAEAPRARVSRIEPAPPPKIPFEKSAPETIVGWRGYDAADLAPATAALALATAVALTFVQPFVPPTWRTELVVAPLAALWVGHAIRGGYRLLTFRSLITSRRLFRTRGPLYPAEPPLDLGAVARVEVVRTPWQRWLGIGTIVVTPEESSGRAPIELPAQRRPAALLQRIEEAAAAARTGATFSAPAHGGRSVADRPS